MTNEEFQDLLEMKKIFLKNNIQLPENNENNSYELKSESTKDRFYLSTVAEKSNFQNLSFKIGIYKRNSLW